MDFYFLDSSAVVKNYVSEVGSTWIRNLINAQPSNEIYLSRLANVEVVAAIVRRAKGGTVSATDAQTYLNQFKSTLQTDFRVVEINLSLVLIAVGLTEKHGLRGYDAMQLAAGISIYNKISQIAVTTFSFTFVSADDELNNSAHAEGLRVDNPNHHP